MSKLMYKYEVSVEELPTKDSEGNRVMLTIITHGNNIKDGTHVITSPYCCAACALECAGDGISGAARAIRGNMKGQK